MPLYIADYLEDTVHLTRDQHGAYLLLIMAAWKRGGILPAEPSQLAVIAKATPSEWRKLAPLVLPFFKTDGDKLIHSRVVREREKAEKVIEVARENGRTGGRPRGKNKTQKEPNPFFWVSKNGGFENPDHNPNLTQKKHHQKVEVPSLEGGAYESLPDTEDTEGTSSQGLRVIQGGAA